MKIKIILASVFILMCGVVLSQTQPDSAQVLLNKAYKQAAKEKKNVFVIFHASWCVWCKKLDASINDPSCKDYFDKSFIFVHLAVLESNDKKNLENPGATEMFNKYSGGNSGIPFFLIFNKKGVLLADSKIRTAGDGLDKPGQNMGCPAAEEEVAAFIEVLKKTSKITDSQAIAIKERFSKNKS
ncbi:MAG: thioredoxin family protein [Bacteroidia bacterium]|nr:thioredoxin family protein [Bacteroidia bacterium]